MNYIITNRPEYFKKIGNYNYCSISDVKLGDRVAVDTETTGLQCFHTGAGFKGAELFAIQYGTGENNYLFDLDSGISIKEVFSLIKDKTIILQNAIFDIRFMLKHNFIPKTVRDTFLASKILYNGNYQGVYNHNFGAIMERELGEIYDKSDQKNIAKIKLSTASAIKYCFNDVDKLLELEEHLSLKLIKADSFEAYKVQSDSTSAIAYMEMCGLPFNKNKWKIKIKEDEINLLKVNKDILNFLDKNLPVYIDKQLDLFSEDKKLAINLNSPQQVIPVFKDLGLNVLNDKGKESLNEKVVARNKHEFVDIWIKRQKLQKSLSTFGENVLEKCVENRIYTSFNPMVDTSRLSCRKGGINFLNFPRDFKVRDSFEALEDFIMVGADYSNQEVFMGCDMHQDPVTLLSIKNGVCLHCAFAKVLYPEIAHLSDDEIKKNHAEKRQAAKAPRFCFQYGGSAFTIHVNEGTPLKRAQEIENGFKELHQGIYNWGYNKLNEAIRKGYVESVAGFKLYLPRYSEFLELKAEYKAYTKEFWESYKIGKKYYQDYYNLKNKETLTEAEELSFLEAKEKLNTEYGILYYENKKTISNYAKLRSEYFKLCLNNPAQSGAAFQTKSALIALFNAIVENGDLWNARISNSPYDEILMEVKKPLAEKYKLLMEKCMVEEGNKWLISNLFEMEADAVIGSSWAQCH
jgi:DNA polymerase I-like protein with 3'-5' exonuclease and polymerase domains